MDSEFDTLVKFLDKNNVKYMVWEHERVHTSEQAAAVRDVDVKTGVKALVFRIQKEKHDDIVLILVRGDHKADWKKLAQVLKARNTRLASPEEVLEKTGCEVGSVHPFGNLFGLPVYMDRTILENKFVNFSAGTHTKSINMQTEDMVRLVKPEKVDIAKAG